MARKVSPTNDRGIIKGVDYLCLGKIPSKLGSMGIAAVI